MYMSGDEIRSLSRRIPEIEHATEEELNFWMDEAADIIHAFCQQDFIYERQTTKTVRTGTNTLVYLPKVISGDVTITDDQGGTVYSNIDPSGANQNRVIFNDSDSMVYTSIGLSTSGLAIELFPGSHVMAYYQGNRTYRSPKAKILRVTADWGFAIDKENFFITAVNTLRACYEEHRISASAHNSVDTSNPIISPAASDMITALTLINEMQNVINSHFGNAVSHKEADTNTSTATPATDIDSGFLLIKDLKKVFNKHCYNVVVHIVYDKTNLMLAGVEPEIAILPRPIRRSFLRLVQRIAIRDDAEDFRQLNSPYSSETLGDGYNYDLSNGTMRNLLRPEEANLLLPYVNRGRVVL